MRLDPDAHVYLDGDGPGGRGRAPDPAARHYRCGSIVRGNHSRAVQRRPNGGRRQAARRGGVDVPGDSLVPPRGTRLAAHPYGAPPAPGPLGCTNSFTMPAFGMLLALLLI